MINQAYENWSKMAKNSMMNQAYENWSQMAKNGMRPMNEWMAMMTKLEEALIREQIRTASDCAGIFLKGYQSAATGKKPEDFLQTSANTLCEAMEKGAESLQNMMNAYTAAIDEAREWSQEHLAHKCLTPECCSESASSSSGSGKSGSSSHSSGHAHKSSRHE